MGPCGSENVKYMLRVTDDELRSRLLQTETYQSRFQADRARKDTELIAAIRGINQKTINVGKYRSTAAPGSIQSRGGNDIVPDMVPDINICSLNNGSENMSRKNTPPLSVESGVVGLLKKGKPKKLDRSQFNDEELAFIDLYHRICLPSGLGFLRVTERSEELGKVLEIFAKAFDRADWTEKFREAVEYRCDVYRTNPAQTRGQ